MRIKLVEIIGGEIQRYTLVEAWVSMVRAMCLLYAIEFVGASPQKSCEEAFMSKRGGFMIIRSLWLCISKKKPVSQRYVAPKIRAFVHKIERLVIGRLSNLGENSVSCLIFFFLNASANYPKPYQWDMPLVFRPVDGCWFWRSRGAQFD